MKVVGTARSRTFARPAEFGDTNGFRRTGPHPQERAWFQEAADAARVIEDIIEVAKRAPSSMNTQPWHVHVLTGEPLEELRRRNMEEMVAGARAKRDIVSHGEYEGVHQRPRH